MNELTALVLEHGVGFVFLNVLLEQLGLPIPAVPTLVVAGALAADGKLPFGRLLAVALVATVAADTVWFLLGRRYGQKILKTLCHVSLSPDSCVRQTEGIFDRYGLASLLVAKFVPGFSTVAPPLAGAAGAPLPRFLLFTAGGTLLWAGCALASALSSTAPSTGCSPSSRASEAARSSSSRARSSSSSPSSGSSGAASTRSSGWRASARPTCAASWTKARRP